MKISENKFSQYKNVKATIPNKVVTLEEVINYIKYPSEELQKKSNDLKELKKDVIEFEERLKEFVSKEFNYTITEWKEVKKAKKSDSDELKAIIENDKVKKAVLHLQFKYDIIGNIKKDLESITGCGVQTARDNKKVISLSSYIIVDIDRDGINLEHFTGAFLKDDMRIQLASDHYVKVAFISPTGGLKLIILIGK